MRRSELFIKTRKQAPSDEESRNAQLLIRAGFVHKEMAGVYSYLPMGKIVIDNISRIIREEMNAVGGNEVLMSTIQRKEPWEASGRWDDKVVDAWFKTKLANGTEVGIGWSHEEPIVSMLKDHINSYKDLPIYPYQIQTKFRNELRAKSGLLRGREFLMKDMYSFSRSHREHDQFYEKVAGAYMKIYDRMGFSGITYRTFASGGSFSRFSDEFQVLSHVGEDTIYIDEKMKIAVNKEVTDQETLNHLKLDMGQLKEEKAVEVGNIFSLGTKYSDALGLKFTDEKGQQQPPIMGCYGIGVSRLMGLIAEHFADDKGLVWPENVAPYQVYLVGVGDSEQVKQAADEIYGNLTESGVSIMYDDRDERPGEKFADADLIGIPYRVVVSEKSLAAGGCELKKRTSSGTEVLSKDQLAERLKIPLQA
ncbi:MAG TPA: aminoacyl--tRNA ligase-related protein [Candidatus Saccharimonadales bacterium]|nr:aminoacyl--tRNA ligase-related protein [Candidatus Saccharimonadales bacterium]